ncbi:MAG TPA: TonB-dependent receptor [Steroidobacteraceae bacterium]|nr:TonB-dependent receptor [Steroidobacteraceae bacterium]
MLWLALCATPGLTAAGEPFAAAPEPFAAAAAPIAEDPAALAEATPIDALQGDNAPAGAPPKKAAAGTTLPPIVVSSEGMSLEDSSKRLDESRDQDLLPKLGASAYDIDQAALQTLPQGQNTPLDKLLLQAPGVSYDSAISNPAFHVRNEYANVQYRIDGIQLPDGVSALGPVLETGFIENLNLLDGVLPAQYGLRTAGVVDITTKSAFDAGAKLDVYAGSLNTWSPSIEYSGVEDETQYFLIGRFLESDEGLENAMPTADPIHDRTEQGKLFGYGSTLFSDSSRLTYMAGAWIGRFQIPDVVGQAPLGDFGPSNLSSARLDENETDRFFFDIVALQTKRGNLDTQLSIFTRYASVHFVPDVYDDLVFNDVASNVVRKSLLNGLELDAADHLSETHVLRGGLLFDVEHTQVDDLSTVLPLAPDGEPVPAPLTLNDYHAKVGWTAGGYLQDEWTIRPELKLNAGLRFDAMSQFVTAHQASPRLALVFTPSVNTTVHAGVSRYFTPPMQAQATPNTLALFEHTTQQQSILLNDPVRPERATYLDVGMEQKLRAGLDVGIDLYYKHATDALDDGQFGQAVVLEQFNYAQGFSRGAELKVNYSLGGFRAYANFSGELTQGKNVVSSQYLIGDPVELAYLATHYTYTSDAQTLTASAGASYRWERTLVTVDGTYGSGLRMGFANEQHSPGYTQWNAAIVQEFDPWHDSRKTLALRVSAINLFDRSYLLRAGTGIGEFAPQYGPRREAFIGLTLKF